ncbi:MAG: NAD(P)/FAD-dependent oxidoreductase [Actinomycetota bacterium]|nr:NAD(P)/FAD-dependent oxidoreductase [Actinomycetota bacterium]
MVGAVLAEDAPGIVTAAETLDVIVIGAGQAGLAIAWHLRRQGLRFVVLDAADRVGHTWRSRWDSLRLFTPARYSALPGMAFPGDPDHYPTKDAVADYLRRYASEFDLPIRLNTTVTGLSHTGTAFEVSTTGQTLQARQVVVATGPFQTPFIPSVSTGIGAHVISLHSSGYRNPEQLAAGPVLVVGGGNSGMQIAEEVAASRPVTLSTGQTPTALPQRLLGRDLFWWLARSGLMRLSGDSRLGRRVRARGELLIGSNRRRVEAAGVSFRARLTSIRGGTAHFSDGTSTEAATVIWATGFRRDYSWINVPGAVVDGQVVHDRGVSPVDGLYFLGMPWQHTRGSALLGFVHADAVYLASRLTVSGRPGVRYAAARPVASSL